MTAITDSIIDSRFRQLNKIDAGIKLRNKAWENNDQIPTWVDLKEVGLDQVFTRPQVARSCLTSLHKYMTSDGANLSNYKFVEPSAGLGSFYDLLPDHRRIGIDVVPFRSDYINSDFLSWTPKRNGHSYVCVGNPPFGYRAWLALIFLNHAALIMSASFCQWDSRAQAKAT